MMCCQLKTQKILGWNIEMALHTLRNPKTFSQNKIPKTSCKKLNGSINEGVLHKMRTRAKMLFKSGCVQEIQKYK